MSTDEIQKLGDAAKAIAEIVKKHRADGEAIRKALEPLRDVVEPRVVEKIVERDVPRPWDRGWPQPLPFRYFDDRPSTADPMPPLPPIYCGPNTCSTRDAPELSGETRVINRVLPHTNGRTSWHVPEGATA